MVNLDELKSIILLSHLTDSMLEKLTDITMTAEHKAGDYIFKEGEYARYLYAVIDGKVGLEPGRRHETEFVAAAFLCFTNGRQLKKIPAEHELYSPKRLLVLLERTNDPVHQVELSCM